MESGLFELNTEAMVAKIDSLFSWSILTNF